MSFRDQINRNKLPKHVAVIMDGNGRWAKKHGKPRVFGHKNGVVAVREAVEAAAEIGISHLTLYAFSTENWNRPKFEVNALMSLLVDTMERETDTLMKNNIRLTSIGDVDKLPKGTKRALESGKRKTAQNDGLNLILALNYSSRWDISQATKRIAQEVKDGNLDAESINDEVISSYLSTANVPDPELLIRTSGENRVSNFLLWEISYAEFYFTDIFWPDFRKEEFFRAIFTFQNRERRFGQTSEQILTKV